MNIKIKNYQGIQKFQEGGEIPADAPVEEAPAGAPAEEAPVGGEDPMMQLAQAFQQGLQTQDCNLLAQAAQAFLQLIGGGAPEEAPGAPVYRRGGKLSRWI